MIRWILEFTKAMWVSLSWPWRLWVGALMLVNMILPLFFLDSYVGKVVLAAFLFAAAIQMLMFRAKGFVRLLGLGHILAWVPLLIWLWPRAVAEGSSTSFGAWMAAVLALDGLSLIVDFVDVARYLGGDREPSYVFDTRR